MLPVVIILFVVCFSAIAAVLIVRAGRLKGTSVPDANWLDGFTPEKYRPMLRLLNEQDFEWLVSQGVEQTAVKELRSERRKIFGTYLDNVSRDFGRLHAAASALVLALPDDQPELAARLVTVRIQFQRTLMLVRFHLVLYDLGLHSVDARRLVAGIEAMDRDLRPLLSAY